MLPSAVVGRVEVAVDGSVREPMRKACGDEQGCPRDGDDEKHDTERRDESYEGSGHFRGTSHHQTTTDTYTMYIMFLY